MRERRVKRRVETDSRRRSEDSGSSSVFSYYSSRSNNESQIGRVKNPEKPEQVNKEKETSSWWYNLAGYVAILVVIVSLLYVFTLTPHASVEVVNSPNTTFLQPLSTYQNYGDKLLSNSILNRFKLTINTDSVASQITKKFPELSGATIVVPLVAHDPVIEIQAAQPNFIVDNKQGSFVIDQAGVAIAETNTSQTQDTSLPLVLDQSGLSYKVGQEALTTSTVSFINGVAYQLKAKNIQVQSFTLVNVPYELNVQPKGEPYYIKFNILGDPRLETGTYIATINQLTAMKTSPAQYVDVRVPGRAYYQ